MHGRNRILPQQVVIFGGNWKVLLQPNPMFCLRKASLLIRLPNRSSDFEDSLKLEEIDRPLSDTGGKVRRDRSSDCEF